MHGLAEGRQTEALAGPGTQQFSAHPCPRAPHRPFKPRSLRLHTRNTAVGWLKPAEGGLRERMGHGKDTCWRAGGCQLCQDVNQDKSRGAGLRCLRSVVPGAAGTQRLAGLGEGGRGGGGWQAFLLALTEPQPSERYQLSSPPAEAVSNHPAPEGHRGPRF